MNYIGPDVVNVIGLSGKAGSGKDFLATRAVVPYGFVPLALANQFKVSAVIKRGLPFDQVFGPTPKSPDTRDILQKMGTEFGRDNFGEDVWCRALELWMLYMVEHGVDRFVITDVRFINEVEWIYGLGGEVFRITGRGGAETEETQQHISETELDGYDDWSAVIDNSPERRTDQTNPAVTELKDYVDAYLAGV